MILDPLKSIPIELFYIMLSLLDYWTIYSISLVSGYYRKIATEYLFSDWPINNLPYEIKNSYMDLTFCRIYTDLLNLLPHAQIYMFVKTKEFTNSEKKDFL